MRTSLVREHTRIGENLRPWTFLLFGALFALVAWEWWTKRQGERSDDAMRDGGGG